MRVHACVLSMCRMVVPGFACSGVFGMWIAPMGAPRSHCDGLPRRNVLRAGTTALLGGLALPDLLALQARAAGVGAKAKSCIFLMLEGGRAT